MGDGCKKKQKREVLHQFSQEEPTLSINAPWKVKEWHQFSQDTTIQ